MGMTFSWGPTLSCDDSNSPPIDVINPPEGTSYYRIKLFRQSTGEARGSAIVARNTLSEHYPYGAFTPDDYRGPCSPPSGVYRLELYALDGAGEIKALAAGPLEFPSSESVK